jgi:hypothetical protein
VSLETYRDVVYSVLRERLAIAIYQTSNMPDAKERLEELLSFLVRMKNDTRWYSLSMPNIVSLWDEINEKDLIFDLVVSATNEMMFRFTLLDNHSEMNFLEKVAVSLTATRRPRTEQRRNDVNLSSAVSEEHIARGLNKDQWVKSFTQDTWLLFLHLLSLLYIDAGVIMQEFTPPPRRKPKDVVDG